MYSSIHSYVGHLKNEIDYESIFSMSTRNIDHTNVQYVRKASAKVLVSTNT